MLIENIYAHAQRTPDRIAVVHNNRPISYRAFARGVDAARRYLAEQELPATGIAVLAVGSILDGYVLGLAVRSLGMTTLLVPSMYHMRRLGRSEAHCVITTDAETWPRLDELCTASATRLIAISAAIYADTGAGAAPALPELPASEGGHILLTSGTTGTQKKVLIGPSTQVAAL
jgi:non-ribosomal peptide synthetase component E (peptide arylation enzyme)